MARKRTYSYLQGGRINQSRPMYNTLHCLPWILLTEKPRLFPGDRPIDFVVTWPVSTLHATTLWATGTRVYCSGDGLLHVVCTSCTRFIISLRPGLSLVWSLLLLSGGTHFHCLNINFNIFSFLEIQDVQIEHCIGIIIALMLVLHNYKYMI